MLFDRITFDPGLMNGQPCIRGMRLTVARVLDAIATYPNREDLQRNYPELEDEDIRQALSYAADCLADNAWVRPEGYFSDYDDKADAEECNRLAAHSCRKIVG